MSTPNSPNSPTNRLDTLPLELISLIFDNIGTDLVSHVAFSQLRPYIYDCCYRNRGREFWEPVLRASGIGRLQGSSDLAEDHEWEELAFECVQHAATCSYAECGMTLLRGNELSMITGIREAGISLMDTLLPDEEEPVPGIHTVQPHDVYSSITFKKRQRTLENHNTQETWQTAAHLRTEAPDGTLDFGEPLVDHPIMWRSFATFAPVAEFEVISLAFTISCYNPDGVVVGDLLRAIMSWAGMKLDTSIFADLLTELERDQAQKKSLWPSLFPDLPILPSSWPLSDMFRALEDYRDWFTVLRWEGLRLPDPEVDDDDDEPSVFFFWNHVPQKLPNDYAEFNRRRMY